MKKFFVSIVFTLCLCLSASAQTVEVDQTFVDDCTKAFGLVVEQRDALEKFQTERARTAEEKAALQAVIDGLNGLLAIKDKTIAQYESAIAFERAQYEAIVKLQQSVIQIQQTVIERLEKMLNKPKSLFDKIIRTLERVALFVGGIVIGRGLTF